MENKIHKIYKNKFETTTTLRGPTSRTEITNGVSMAICS